MTECCYIFFGNNFVTCIADFLGVAAFCTGCFRSAYNCFFVLAGFGLCNVAFYRLHDSVDHFIEYSFAFLKSFDAVDGLHFFDYNTVLILICRYCRCAYTLLEQLIPLADSVVYSYLNQLRKL